MSHPRHLRETARQMRAVRGMTLDDIAAQLAVPKSTVWSWISDLPLPASTPRQLAAQRRAVGHVVSKYKALRDDAYAAGAAEFERLCAEPTFRDFVCLYIATGNKRDRNRVNISDSDAAVVRVSDHWIRRFSRRGVTYHLDAHVDQDLDEVRAFWSSLLRIDAQAIRLQRKATGARLRAQHGVLAVNANDTLLRARLQAWIDRVRADWL